ncbi:MAG: DUF2628 domain-containing protein, partial [Pseudomonadota bacterium]
MATYRVFKFTDALPEAVENGDNIRIVRDGFSVLALVFPLLWLLWHRLWIGVLAYLVIAAAFIAVSELVNPLIGFALNSLFGLYLGFEATNWQTMTLTRNGWKEVDVVLASDGEEAEMRALGRQRNEGRDDTPEP